MKSRAQMKRSFEYVKLIAACFVVFAHIHFPGMLGRVLDGMRFRTPLFFAISGYFSFQTGSERLMKRLRHILFLALVSTALYAVYGAAEHVYLGKGTAISCLIETFKARRIASWLFMNLNPTSFHLWYLSAILTCYAVLWLYVKLREGRGKIDYGPLYTMSACLFAILMLASMKFLGAGVKANLVVYRNGLFLGLPMFCSGLYIREEYEHIVRAFNLTAAKELLIFIAGTALGVFQFIWHAKVDLPLASYFAVCALLLLAIRASEREDASTWKNACAHAAGKCSLIVYIMHIMIHRIVLLMAKKSAFWAGVVREKSVYPLVIVGLSLLLGLAVVAVQSCWKRLFRLGD